MNDIAEPYMELKCSCDKSHTMDEHPGSCALWDDEAYSAGDAIWNPAEERLVPSDEFLDEILDDLGMTGFSGSDFDEPTDVLGCKCEPECVHWCSVTKCWRTTIKSAWEPSVLNSNFKKADKVWGKASNQLSKWDIVYEPKCRHYFEQVVYPDETKIRISSQAIDNSRDDNEHPDYACYFTTREPVCVATYLPWADFAWPKVGMDVVDLYVRDVIAHARAGEEVEIGCIGGHGRTGTFMALMGYHCGVVDDGMEVQDATDVLVKWVRETFCKEAIEGKKQEWYIAAYVAWYAGVEWPDWVEPVVEKKKKRVWDKELQKFVDEVDDEQLTLDDMIAKARGEEEDSSLTSGVDASKMNLSELVKSFFKGK